MSLGGPVDPVLDAAVSNSIAAGVTYVVAAGNSYADACRFSPAHLPDAVTVAATDNTDTRIPYSNRGACVDLFAPGADITSTSHSSDTGTRVLSGTSMAAPHVAGAAALYLQSDPTGTPDQVSAWLTGNATPGVVQIPQGSPNLLLFTGGLTNPMAMTWRVRQQRPDNLVLVGSDEQTDPYQGDTPDTTSLPLLCLQQTGAPIPAGITPDQYHGWSGGALALTAPVPGTRLTSFAAASQLCEASFGSGWRMAEFHDGYHLSSGLPGLPGLPRPPRGPRTSGRSRKNSPSPSRKCLPRSPKTLPPKTLRPAPATLPPKQPSQSLHSAHPC